MSVTDDVKHVDELPREEGDSVITAQSILGKMDIFGANLQELYKDLESMKEDWFRKPPPPKAWQDYCYATEMYIKCLFLLEMIVLFPVVERFNKQKPTGRCLMYLYDNLDTELLNLDGALRDYVEACNKKEEEGEEKDKEENKNWIDKAIEETEEGQRRAHKRMRECIMKELEEKGDKRVCRIFVTPERLLDVLKGTYDIRVKGLPKDVEIIDADYDYLANGFILWVKSKEFDPVPPDEPIPELIVTVQVKEEENEDKTS